MLNDLITFELNFGFQTPRILFDDSLFSYLFFIIIRLFPVPFQITDAILSGANETIPKVDVLVSDDRKQLNENELIVKNQIPTAIVKPKKYQRSSFDDRQLPAVAYMNDDQLAWYDKPSVTDASKCSASATAVAVQPKKIHLPEFDRNAKKHVKSTNSANSAHNTVETAHNKQITATDNTINSSDAKVSETHAVTNRAVASKSKKKGASVAVVQPRKKERMDERKLMETILQMQIKKNALYRGQYNNNKPNTNIDTNTSTNTTSATIKTSSVKQSSGNMKYSNNNNNVNNNNNGENNTNTELNQAKKDRKDNSGMSKK